MGNGAGRGQLNRNQIDGGQFIPGRGGRTVELLTKEGKLI
jgi:hypothetical protein